MDVVATTGADALLQTVGYVLDHGERVAPRGFVTREVRHFSLTIANPRDALCTGIGANQSRRVVAAEALRVIGGFDGPDFAVRHVPHSAQFVNLEANRFDGAYGPRLRDQYQHALDRLRRDPDTRQSILSIWNKGDLERPQSLDYPCTLLMGLFLRNDKLELDVVMRSNDVNWGLKNDLFVFTQLQLSLANVLGVDVGPYRHTAMSMHLYDRDLEWADGLHERDDPVVNHPQGFGGHDAHEMVLRARAVAFGWGKFRWLEGKTPTPTEQWYLDALESG